MVSINQQKVSFGRRLDDKEMPIYTNGIKQARALLKLADPNDGNKETKLNNTTLIFPDFYAPGRTLNSKAAMQIIEFMQTMTAINTVQGLPRGPVSNDNLSPFSSSPFELGEHLIDKGKLKAKYGTDDLQKAHTEFKERLKTDKSLAKAYKDFNNNNSHLERYGMLDALKEHEYGTDYWQDWSGKNAELDKNLFNYDETKPIPEQNRLRQEEIKDKYKDDIDFYKFKQFVGYEQHKDTKNELNAKGIKFIGDCLIGFSYRDEWAFKNAFEPGKSLGVADTITADSKEVLGKGIGRLGPNDKCKITIKTGEQTQEIMANSEAELKEILEPLEPGAKSKITIETDDTTKYKADIFKDWGTSCLDNNKLYANGSKTELGAAGKVLKKKFDTFFENYDGARIDAGWQVSHPLSSKNNPAINKPGRPLEVLGQDMLKVMEMALKDQNANRTRNGAKTIDNEDICMENLGGRSSEASSETKNKYSHIHLTRYANPGWGRPAFYNDKQYDKDDNDHFKTYTGYKLSGLTMGIGCHDDVSAIDVERGCIDNSDYTNNTVNIDKRNEQAELLAKDLKLDASTLKTRFDAFRDAKFGELFTARNQFFTISDALGDERRLNNPDAVSDEEKSKNWTSQTPENYEQVYFRNLSEGKGLNVPAALAIAIRAKMDTNNGEVKKTLKFLDKAARILKERGPLTREGANKALASDDFKGETLLKETPEVISSAPSHVSGVKMTKIPLELHAGIGENWSISDEQIKSWNEQGFKAKRNEEEESATVQLALPFLPNTRGILNFILKKDGQFRDDIQGKADIKS